MLRSLLFSTSIRPQRAAHLPTCSLLIRHIHHCTIPLIKAHKMPQRPKIIEEEITEVFLKGGSGPGGQKINKCNSKVQLKHLPTGIVVTCQATRSREQNRKKAREILAMKVQHLADPENSRQSKLEERKIQRAETKKKKTKRKYVGLEEERLMRKEMEEREELEFLASMAKQ